MAIAPLTLRKDYWQELSISDEDLEFLYNYLLEIETPQTSQELAQVLIGERIQKERKTLEQQQQDNNTVYLPKNHYQVGQKLIFPAQEWQEGEVVAVRAGNNPEYDPFEVIDVRFASKNIRSFASGIQNHSLNEPIVVNQDDPALNPANVSKLYGKEIARMITETFEANDDLVRIAGRWFPRALLVDVNIGYLNLAEAVLEVEEGGPLSTARILEQIELPTDVNPKLTEFSLNLALEEDERFDEVGPAGEVQWYLHRLEPEEVRKMPQWLQHRPVNLQADMFGDELTVLEAMVADELEISNLPVEEVEEMTISLIYPHYRAGTLPLNRQMAQLFPTAYESPRVRFTFVDAENGKKFSGWVVRANHYIYGLRDWYLDKEIIPGSLIRIRKSENPGEVIVQAMRKRPTKEWIRTVLVGADNGIVFAMLKHQVSNTYDERMAIAIPDQAAIDELWQAGHSKGSLEQTIMNVLRELAKLNPQGQVHAQELYAAVNIVRRSSPAAVLHYIMQNPRVVHLGDLYFRLDETRQGEKAYE